MAERTVPTPAQQQAPGPSQEQTRAREAFAVPAVDIYEDDKGLVVVADLPGVDPGSLDVRVERGILTIQGRASPLATGDAVYREYELSGFFRQFQLPEEVDSSKIEADLKEGVLMLRVPRAEPTQPRRIEVRST